MKTKHTLLAALFFLLCSSNLFATPSDKLNVCDFRSDMRKLWEDHITWTRNVILNFLDTLPGTEPAVARLLRNQDDIGNAIKPFYGEAAGDALTDLLYGHILTAADILVALRNGDNAAYQTANAAWYANADSIAVFLAAANPNWSLEELRDMMNMHLDQTAAEAVARLTKDYDADVAAYDEVHDHILMMADMLTDGIVAQFPNMFGGPKHKIARPQEVVLRDAEFALQQNSPNPFTEQTTIDYSIPESAQNAQIIFTDNAGRVIKSATLEQKGEATINVITNGLSKGVYTYSIMVDGKVMDTKRMVRQ